MMNTEVKKLWVDALRSGRYDQTTMALRSGDCYCALGVLCALARDAGVVTEYSYEDGTFQYGKDKHFWAPPDEVAEWAGLLYRNPRVLFYGDSCTIAALNDEYEISFEEIADVIEEQL